MVERIMSSLRDLGPVVILVLVAMNWLAHLTSLAIDKPVEAVTVAGTPQQICQRLADKHALPDWFSWVDEADPATVVRKNYIVPAYEQDVYVFRPGTDQAGRYFALSVERSNCDADKPLHVTLRLHYLQADDLAVRTQDYQPFVRTPFRRLGDFDIEYTIEPDGAGTRVGFIVRSCAQPRYDNPTGCWGNLEISFMGMFEPLYRWPVEAAFADSLHRFKALAGHAG